MYIEKIRGIRKDSTKHKVLIETDFVDKETGQLVTKGPCYTVTSVPNLAGVLLKMTPRQQNAALRQELFDMAGPYLWSIFNSNPKEFEFDSDE